MNFRELLLSTVALIVFASAYALIKICLTELPPMTLGAIRFVLASLFMVPLTIGISHGKGWQITRSDVPFVVGLGGVQIFLPNLLQNIGMEYANASVSSVLQSTTPVFTLVLAFVLLKEHIRWQEVLGVVIGMAGVVLLSTGGEFAGFNQSILLGNILQVGVAASYAVSGIVGKVLLRKHSPLNVVTLAFVIGAAMLSGSAVTFERSEWPHALSIEVMVALLLLSLLYCVALVSWYLVLQHTVVFELYVLLFAMPVLAVIISVVVLGESFTLLDVAFSALTLLGVAITQLTRPK